MGSFKVHKVFYDLADEAKEEVGMRLKVWGSHGMTPKRVTKLQRMRAIEHYFRVAQAEPFATQGDLFFKDGSHVPE